MLIIKIVACSFHNKLHVERGLYKLLSMWIINAYTYYNNAAGTNNSENVLLPSFFCW